MEEKQLPHDTDAEIGVLGSVLIIADPDSSCNKALDIIAPILAPEDMNGHENRIIYATMLDMYSNGRPVDLITLCGELARRGKIEEVGGVSYVYTLPDHVPTTGNIKAYAKSVRAAAITRRFIFDMADATASAHLDGIDAALGLVARRLNEREQERIAGSMDDPLRPRSLAEMLDQPPPELLIDRHLMRRGVSMLAGDGGSGKTLLAGDWGMHIALGLDWNGCKVHQGTVLFVAGEGGSGFARRAAAWLEHHYRSPDDIKDRLYIIPHAVQVLDDAQRARAVAYAKTLPGPIAYVVIETLSQTAGGADQNDNGEMAAYVRACREISDKLETHVTFTHHALKTGNGYRGASSLKDDSDTTILVSREGDVSTAHCEKQRDGWEYFPDFTFTGSYVSPPGANGLSYGVFEYTGLKERTERSERKQKNIPASKRLVLEAISQRPGITRPEVVAYCKPMEIAKSTVHGAINGMVADGWISEGMDGLTILPACPVSSSFVQTGHSGLAIVRPVQSSIS